VAVAVAKLILGGQFQYFFFFFPQITLYYQKYILKNAILPIKNTKTDHFFVIFFAPGLIINYFFRSPTPGSEKSDQEKAAKSGENGENGADSEDNERDSEASEDEGLCFLGDFIGILGGF
jgi:hypothetical protein